MGSVGAQWELPGALARTDQRFAHHDACWGRADPQGGNFCVWQAKVNKGIGVHNAPGAFCWGQLNTTDTAKAEAFYTVLFGWQAKTGTGGGMTYLEWLLGGNPIGGMMALPPGAPPQPHWLARVPRRHGLRRRGREGRVARGAHVRPADRDRGHGGCFAVYKE